MKVTCGTDIIEVERIENAIEKFGDKFTKRIYTETEANYCNNKLEMKYQHFAARFAAKEAIFKAISQTLNNKYDLKWTDVEIVLGRDQKPLVHFLKEFPGIEQIDISLSHIKEYATATCVAVLDEQYIKTVEV